MSLGKLTRGFQHVSRYREITSILVRYGFGDLVRRLALDERLGIRTVTRGKLKLEDLSRAQRVRMMLTDLGPTFVKLGQILSMRPDLIPTEYVGEFSKLQEDVPPFPADEARHIIETELGHPVDSLFRSFDDEPLASASLGQVYRAVDSLGRPVAIKVQRPGIVRRIKADLEIMLHLAGLLERRVAGWDVQHPTAVVEELARSIDRELDYTLEASHMERFAEEFSGDTRIHVPSVDRELTTPRVLTMEFIRGLKPDDRDELIRSGLDPHLIARRGADLILEQILLHGFFHADPHSGNLRILDKNVICYLDYGMMGRLDLEARQRFVDLLLGIADRDEATVAEALTRMTIVEQEPDRAELERDLAELLDRHFYRPLKDVRIGRFLQDLVVLVSRHHLRIPPNLYLMLKSLGTVEGVGRVLDADFDMIRHAAPLVRKIAVARWRPDRIAREFGTSGLEMLRLAKTLPRELQSLLTKAHRGDLRLILEHRALEVVLISLERVGNRLAFAVVLAALIVGSAIMVASHVPPTFLGMPLIGVIGFVSAALMGFWLLVSILRHNKM